MEGSSRERIEQFWVGVFGTSDRAPRPVITAHRSPWLDGYPGIYCIVRNETVFVSAPDVLVANTRAWQPSPTTAIDPVWWSERLPTWSVIGPSVHAFLDHEPKIISRPLDLKIESADVGDLADLCSAVAAAEWGESGFAGDDISFAWRGIADDGCTVAAANLTPFDEMPADVGVLTSPQFRGRGAASVVAGTAARYAVREFGIARWRALTSNIASQRTSARLGFEPDCLQVAIRPPDRL